MTRTAMGGIGLDRVALISIVVEALLLGVFFVLFAYSHSITFQRRRLDKRVNIPLWMASWVMVVLALAHLATDAQRLVLAFLTPNDNPSTFLGALNTPTFLLKSILFMVQMVIGDACSIYRLFILWSRNIPVIILPVMLTTGFVVTAVSIVYQLAIAKPAAVIFALDPWGCALFASSLATNFLCTALICYRIWRTAIRRRTPRRPDDLSRAYTTILVTIIESGAIYSAALIALLISYLVGSYGHFIVLDSITSIVGITFTMINLRVSQGYVLPTTSAGPSAYSFSTDDGAFDLRMHNPRALNFETSSTHYDDDAKHRDADGGVLPFFSMRPTSGGIADVTHLSTIDEVSSAAEVLSASMRSKRTYGSLGGVSTMMSTSTATHGADEVFGGDTSISDGYQ